MRGSVWAERLDGGGGLSAGVEGEGRVLVDEGGVVGEEAGLPAHHAALEIV